MTDLKHLPKGYDEPLNKMTEKQVFITCCEKETISRLHAGKVFKIENGKAVD